MRSSSREEIVEVLDVLEAGYKRAPDGAAGEGAAAVPGTEVTVALGGYLCEVHHCDPYRTNPVTDVNQLAFGCGPNHDMAEHGWTTRKNNKAQTELIPPPHLDHR